MLTGGRGVVWGWCVCWAAVTTGADPLLWLRMEEGSGSVTYDASAWGHDAELRAGAAWITPGARWSTNAALRFDGLSNHAVAATFPYPEAFVLSFRFRCTNNSGTSYQYLYRHGVAGETNSLSIYLGEDA